MRKQVKQLTALILAMAMCLSLLSANVWAAEEPMDGSVSTQSSVEMPTEEESTIAKEMPDEESAPEKEAPLTTQGVVASGNCGDNLTWTLDNEGTLSISGTGPMTYGDNVYNPPWGDFSDEIRGIAIGGAVTTIKDFAFSDCENLTILSIPGNISLIGMHAFSECEKLATVTIESGVTTIDQFAFYKCGKLNSIVIPDSVKSIGERTFEGCEKLKNVFVPANVASIGKDAFGGTAKGFTISGYTGTIAELYAKSNGIAFDSQGDKDPNETVNSGTCGENLNWELNGAGTLTISGTGSMEDFYETEPGWGYSIKSVVIQSGVTSIGSKAFLSRPILTSVTIPGTVTSIGKDAFAQCYALTSISIPYGVTTIGEDAFYNCYSLKKVEISDSVITIGEEAFYECSSLTSVTIPASVKTIGDTAFGSFEVEYVPVDIYGFPGTAAQEYAIEYGFKFISLKKSDSKLSATKGLKVKLKKNTATVTWKKNTKGKGYQLQYSTDKKFKKSVKTVKISKNKTVKATVKKLKKGTWYFRIRTVNGKKTSGWSEVKSVKVK